MKVAPNYMLVKINKAERTRRREMMEIKPTSSSSLILAPDGANIAQSFNLYLSPNHIHMTRELQYGEVVQIGSLAEKFFPYASVGDTAMFHHTVETDDASRLLYEEGDYEYRILKAAFFNDTKNKTEVCNWDIYGFIKRDGVIFAANQFIFLEHAYTPFREELKSDLIILEGNHTELSEDKINADLFTLERRCEQLKGRHQIWREKMQKTGVLDREKVDLMRQINEELDTLYARRQKLTSMLHASRLITIQILSISDEARRETDVSKGDFILAEKHNLYELEVMGDIYYILKKDHAIAKLN